MKVDCATGSGVAGARTQVTLGLARLLDYARTGVKGVDGDIHSVVAANGRLFVTTRDGTILLFWRYRGFSDLSPGTTRFLSRTSTTRWLQPSPTCAHSPPFATATHSCSAREMAGWRNNWLPSPSSTSLRWPPLNPTPNAIRRRILDPFRAGRPIVDRGGRARGSRASAVSGRSDCGRRLEHDPASTRGLTTC